MRAGRIHMYGVLESKRHQARCSRVIPPSENELLLLLGGGSKNPITASALALKYCTGQPDDCRVAAAVSQWPNGLFVDARVHFRARMDIQYACVITSRMDEGVPLIRQAESRWEAGMRVHPEVAAMGLPKAVTTPGPEKDQLIPVPVSARTRSRPTHSSGLVQSELHMPVLQ
ncbi:hypothetical protein CCMA1212_006522 [Trichoderma ghanense]|uniref:Uncharacterized protein n=1 Tax=Trichoderma ghanense TaxID=65468 RepID=A0ABY2H221_9HYPO